MTDQTPDERQLHVDDDWKAQARAEKQKLAEEAQSQGPGGPGRIPPADFPTLISTMVTQALMYMGAIPDPMTGQRIAHLELAKHHIDMLGVLQEKTKGNLDEEESQTLDQSVSELRQAFVQLSQQVAAQSGDLRAAQAAAREAQESGGAPAGEKPASPEPPKDQGPGSGGIVMP